MDCPKCGTWNPDDKEVCWRCQTPLPKPEPPRRKRQPQLFLGLPLWAWMVVLLLFLAPTFAQCFFLPTG